MVKQNGDTGEIGRQLSILQNEFVGELIERVSRLPSKGFIIFTAVGAAVGACILMISLEIVIGLLFPDAS